MSFPVLDNHLHLQPQGRNVEAIREFQKEGGTHAILCHLPYYEVPILEGEDFRRSYDITLGLAERCNRETDVRVWVTVGPYPVLLLDLERKLGLQRASEVMREGMDIAADLVQEGRCIAIGEIGRPHFPVSDEILRESNDIMEYGMRRAAEIGCPVVLHTESSGPEEMGELGRMADRAGLPREKVVKHYSPPLVTQEETHGLFPSILASRPAMSEACSKGTRFLMETDYIDDPQRPGAVMPPKTVPKRMRWLLQEERRSEEDALRIHKENPERVYGIEVQ